MKKEELSKFFVFNNTKYTLQGIDEEGKITFKEVTSKLDENILAQHLQGLKTVGVYPDKSGKTKWFCVDIDIIKEVYSGASFDRETYLKQLSSVAKDIKEKFAVHEIPFYQEDTGGKGIHLWCFFEEPIKIKDLLTAFTPILSAIVYDKDIINIEWFPNIENGNSVKLPGGRNLRYNIFSSMEVPMSTVQTVPSFAVMGISNPLEATFTKCRAFRELKEKADVEEKLNHKERLAVASMCYGLDKHYLQYAENYFFKDLDNYKHEVTWKELEQASRTAKPQRCKTLQDAQICSAQCAEIGLKHRSPIGFFADAVNERKMSETDIAFIDPQDALLKQQNHFLYKGANDQYIVISNFILEILEEESVYDDLEGDPIRTYLIGKIVTSSGDEYEFKMDREQFHNTSALERHVYNTIGVGRGVYLTSKKMDLFTQCVNKFSKPSIIKKTINFGFNKDRTVYYTPTLRIDKNMIIPNEDIIVSVSDATKSELEKYLDLATPTGGRSEKYWKDYLTEELAGLYHTPFPILVGLSHVFDLFLKPIYGPTATSNFYILWYSGESGAGKSALATALFRMFGDFPKVYNFASTAGRLEYSGYFYKDALYLIDDFKLAYFSEFQKTEIFRLLQTYADKTGRSRLNRNIQAQKEYWIRGNLMVTGEDILVQESSNIARVVRIDLKVADSIRDAEKFNLVHSKSIGINELTPSIIKHCLNLNPSAVDGIRAKHNARLSKMFEEKSVQNLDRVSANYSRAITGGLVAAEYLYGNTEEYEEIVEDFLTKMDEAFKSQMQTISEENAASRFWDTLQEMIATNRVRIAVGTEHIDDSKVPVVGFIKDTHIFIMYRSAIKFVKEYLQRTSPLMISDSQLCSNLYNQKYVSHHPSKSVYYNGKNVRVYQVNVEKQLDLLEVSPKDDKENAET